MSQQQPPPGPPGYGHQPPVPGPPSPPGPGWAGPPGPPAGQPYGPPPGYGPAPYGPPPGNRGTSKGVIAAIILGALLVVGGGVTAAVLLLGGGEDDSSDGVESSSQGQSEADRPNPDPESPDRAVEPSTGTYEETVTGFAEALRQRDCTAIDALSTRKRVASMSCVQLTARIGPGWTVGDPQLTSTGDNAAAATVPLDADGVEVPIAVDIVEQNGKWLIDRIDITNLL